MGFQKHHDTIFRLLFILHHPSYGGLTVNLKTRGQEVVVDIGPNEELLTPVLGVTYGHCTHILSYFREVFDLGCEEETRKLLTKTEEIRI